MCLGSCLTADGSAVLGVRTCIVASGAAYAGLDCDSKLIFRCSRKIKCILPDFCIGTTHGVWVVKVFGTLRFLIMDACVVSLGSDGVTEWAL